MSPPSTHENAVKLASPSADPTLAILTTSMTFQSGKKISIECATDIKVELLKGGTIYLRSPATLSLMATDAMLLTPELGENFVRGWEKLPEELKLNVIGHHLVNPTLHAVYNVTTTSIVFDFEKRDFSNSALLYQHLSMTPDVDRLAQDVFYTQNTFLVERALGNNWLPPFPARHLIRKLHVDIDLNPRGIRKLRSIARDFTSLQELDIRLYSDQIYNISSFRQDVALEGQVKVKFIISSRHSLSYHRFTTSHSPVGTMAAVERFKKALDKYITFSKP